MDCAEQAWLSLTLLVAFGKLEFPPDGFTRKIFPLRPQLTNIIGVS